jgi:hypothetical protein
VTDYPDDPQRLTRLGEEIRGRLQEMALIGARIAGIQLDPAATPRFAPLSAPASGLESGHGAVTMVEIFDATANHPQMCVSWWSDGTTGLDSAGGTVFYHSQ